MGAKCNLLGVFVVTGACRDGFVVRSGGIKALPMKSMKNMKGQRGGDTVVPAKAGAQGASGHFWIPACAGMTRSAKCLVTTALTEPPSYPDIRPQDISHPQQSPLHELHALHG